MSAWSDGAQIERTHQAFEDSQSVVCVYFATGRRQISARVYRREQRAARTIASIVQTLRVNIHSFAARLEFALSLLPLPATIQSLRVEDVRATERRARLEQGRDGS